MKKYTAPNAELLTVFSSDIITGSPPQSGENDTPMLGAVPDQNQNNDNI